MTQPYWLTQAKKKLGLIKESSNEASSASNSLDMVSAASVSGYLTVNKVYDDHVENHFTEKKNIIVLTALQAFLAGLYLSGQTSDPITTLWVGTGGTIDPAGQFPKPVSQSLTGLFTPLTSVTTSYTVNNSVPSVTFLGAVDQSTANGSLITEAGLFKASGLMFNIKTFPGIPKTAEFAIQFSWTIELS
jgi:hypothetical protein